MVNPLSRLGILPDKNDYRGWEYYDASLRAVLQDMNEYGTTPFNLIPNPGFESSMAFWYSVQGLNTVVTDSSSAHTGNKYLKMTAGAASVVGAGIQDSTAARYLEAMPNGVYLLSTYSYLETAASTFVARIEFFDKDKASISVSSSTNSTVGSWQAKTLTATAPANTKYLQVQLYSACASSFVTRVDDISLTMVSDSIYTLIPVSDLDTAHFLRGDYTWIEPPDHADFAGSAHGLVPASAGGTTNFLRADGSWAAASSTIYKTYTWIVKTPGAGWVPGPYIYQACTAIRIDCYVAAATNAVFNIEVRSAPGTSGNDLNSSDITATTSLVSDTSLQNTSISAGSILVVDIASVSGTPGYLAVCLTVSVP